MKTIPKPDSLLSTLQTFPTFQGVEEKALIWMLDNCILEEYDYNEPIFRPDEEVTDMMILVKGSFAFYQSRNGEEREFGKFEAGNVSGVLPFSRLTHVRAISRAQETAWVLKFPKSLFTEMVSQSYTLTQNLVAVMSDRIRDFSQSQSQTEKLMALGRLSAGLAHELNNPASAIVRNAEELYVKMQQTPKEFKAVMALNVTPEETDVINGIVWPRIGAYIQSPPEMSFLDREDAKDELLDWLEDREVEDAEDIADTFVDFAMTTGDLDKVAEVMGDRPLGGIMRWFDNRLSLERIVLEIKEASGRIANLVQSVKTYSHMDQTSGPEATDIHEGLRSTAVMLNSKFKEKNIRLVKEFDTELPQVVAYVSELNQVWTNLISNAVDAMEHGGTLILRTFRDRNFVCVEVEDNGAGIPKDLINRIWEPFYTTKAIGEGTGMGLDIVKKILDKHRARVKVDSQPGKTVFNLCFDSKKESATN